VQLLVVKALFLRLDAPIGAQSRRSSYGPSVVIRRRRVVVVVVVGCVCVCVQTYRQTGLGG
jgi:hypothetical protein